MRIDDIYAQKCDEPSDINEHLPTLRAYSNRCSHVTEFGVRHIVSTWALIAGRPLTVVSYDISSPGDEAINQLREIASDSGVAFRFHHQDVRLVTIEPTDLLFIDTYHTETQLREELKRHANNVKRWIILHDTETFGEKGEAESERGLNYAISEFLVERAGKWKMEKHFQNNNGLTILARR